MIGGNNFTFKRFEVNHEGCAMKVGTDGVLLGAWCVTGVSGGEVILDIGTGTGVIALQLAQRTEDLGTSIDAIEMDTRACLAAALNFEASEWSDRLKLYNADVKAFVDGGEHEGGYDRIVSNPPYFIDSLASPDVKRNVARHTVSLGYDELMNCCARLLKPAGHVSLIVPAGAETERMIAAADACDFVISRRTDVHSTPKSGPKRTLLEFSRRGEVCAEAVERTSLVIGGDDVGTFSDDYRALTRDFYIRF